MDEKPYTRIYNHKYQIRKEDYSEYGTYKKPYFLPNENDEILSSLLEQQENEIKKLPYSEDIPKFFLI